MMTRPLLVPDIDSLRRKLANPPPLLAKLYARFRQRLATDPEFRKHHVFLPALLGEPEAIAEAKTIIAQLISQPLELAYKQSDSSKATAQESLDGHIWCVAPRAMRLAVYFTWLDAHGAWTKEERHKIGTAMLDFFHTYVVPVLRARTPAGHNQQFSMTFCSAVAGHVFAELDGGSLHEYALPKFRQVLGLMPASGYSGEGSTYQSDVVSPLVMWAGIFLEQIGETRIWEHPFEPNGGRLADALRMEAGLGSCGEQLPPWDHYGWGRIHNLAARTLWASLSGDAQLLSVAESAWDEESFIAWRNDDRLWTLLYWPEQEADASGPADALTGWSLPAVGATIEHTPRKLRVMSVWDRCSGGLQGVCRGQVNPNHLMIDLAGEPITADGWEDGRQLLTSDASWERTLKALAPVEKELLAQQFGSLEQWAKFNQHGFLGQASSIIVDGWESYFPRGEREGRLLFERREANRHTFTGEAAAYYQPAFDVTRMRRTVSVGESGFVWIVDDVRADSIHDFTWRVWLRRGARLTGPQRVQLDLPTGTAVTLAWLADAPVTLTTVPTFPQGRGDRYPWPDEGSVRCDQTVTGQKVRLVTCLAPAATGDLAVRQVAANEWEAGADRFALPEEIGALPDPAPVTGKQITEQHALCDLDEPPFALLEESDTALLAALDNPPKAAWRRTGAAMQTLVARGNREALPKIVTLLEDAGQNYTVHSVAAWCLGHARFQPAREALQRMANIPEDNTAARARWGLERLTT
jgi:hypothetical protein